jgi:hypothetical protein
MFNATIPDTTTASTTATAPTGSNIITLCVGDMAIRVRWRFTHRRQKKLNVAQKNLNLLKVEP